MSSSPIASAPASTSLAEPPGIVQLGGPVLVATDGTDDALPALEMARVLGAHGATVEVVAVLEPLVLPPAEFGAGAVDIDADRQANLQQRVEQQVADTFGVTAPAAVRTVTGIPVSEIADIARTRHAALIVTGLRHHGRLDRALLRGETPLRIARAARTPVLVAPAHMRRLPRVAVVATDCEEASISAARFARPLLAEAEVVHVIHVRSLAAMPGGEVMAPWTELFAAIEREHFEHVVAALGLPSSARVETRSLSGHPVDEVLEYAEYLGAELIVTGYRKRLLVDRLTGPRSVAERLYRGTRCAMLLVPETAVAATDVAGMDVYTAPAEWSAPLAAFSARNAGRPAHLEIDTPALGAQAQVAGFPFRGADFERTSGTLLLVFGREGDDPSHLTHGIVRPTSVEIRHDAQGHDLALRVSQREGQALLTFLDGHQPAPRG